MNGDITLGIDVGGSSVKIGLVNEAGEVVRKTKLVPSSKQDPNILFAEISSSARQLLNGVINPIGIGICAPGYADSSTGILINGSGNVPALREASISDYLGGVFDLPTTVSNDGVCSALGELEFGLGRETDTFAFVTLGTGVGGAIVWKRQILQGDLFEPPEFGSVVVRPGEEPTRHGIAGSLENFAGAKAMLKRYEMLSGEELSQQGVKQLFEMSLSGDAYAVAVIDDMLDTVAQLLGTIVNLTGVRNCVLGGGISARGSEILNGFHSRLAKYTWPFLREKCELHLSRCGEAAGILGAAHLVRLSRADETDRVCLDGSDPDNHRPTT